MNKDEYAESLNSPQWRKCRNRIKWRDGNRCRLCCSRGNLQVHHQQYIPGKAPWDYPDNLLITLCARCHRKQHNTPTIISRTVRSTRERYKAERDIVLSAFAFPEFFIDTYIQIRQSDIVNVFLRKIYTNMIRQFEDDGGFFPHKIELTEYNKQAVIGFRFEMNRVDATAAHRNALRFICLQRYDTEVAV